VKLKLVQLAREYVLMKLIYDIAGTHSWNTH
jgi:hypothetical protein